jgi:hypothetical protein
MAPAAHAGKISLSIQELDIREVMQMLSREQRLNIFVADGVSGDVSVNLYDMETDQLFRHRARRCRQAAPQRSPGGSLVQGAVRGYQRNRNHFSGVRFRVWQHQGAAG